MSTTRTGTVKLYRFIVTQSATFVVAARDETEADRVAEKYAIDALDGAVFGPEVDCDGEIQPDSPSFASYADEIPYSEPAVNPDDLTGAELLEEQAKPPCPRPDESKGPVVYCDRCARERVQWDWREAEQVCGDCREWEARVPA